MNYNNPAALAPNLGSMDWASGGLKGMLQGQQVQEFRNQMAQANLLQQLAMINEAQKSKEMLSTAPTRQAQDQLARMTAQSGIQVQPDRARLEQLQVQGQLGNQPALNNLTQLETQQNLQTARQNPQRQAVTFLASMWPQAESIARRAGASSLEMQDFWNNMNQQFEQLTGQKLPPQFSVPNPKALQALQISHYATVNEPKHLQEVAKQATTEKGLDLRNRETNQTRIRAAEIAASGPRGQGNATQKAIEEGVNFRAGQLIKEGRFPDTPEGQQQARGAAMWEFQTQHRYPSPATRADATADAAGPKARNTLKGTLDAIQDMNNPQPQQPAKPGPTTYTPGQILEWKDAQGKPAKLRYKGFGDVNKAPGTPDSAWEVVK